MEFWRKKNTDTRVVFPVQKTDGTFITGATGLDSEFALYGAHGAGAPSFGDCTHEATEIGTTGLYYLDVSAAELNDDYGSVIQVKSSSAGAITQVLLFHTRPNEVDAVKVLGTALTETSGGYLAAGFKKLFDVATPVLTAASVNQTGDNYARLGAPVGASAAADLLTLMKLLRNKVVTNPTTGVMTVYDDNGTDVLYTANVYEDVAGTLPFDGTGANRRDRLA